MLKLTTDIKDEVCATNKSVNASGAGSIQKMQVFEKKLFAKLLSEWPCSKGAALVLQSLHTTAMVVKDSDKEDVSQVVKFHDECNNPGCSFFCPTFDFSQKLFCPTFDLRNFHLWNRKRLIF